VPWCLAKPLHWGPSEQSVKTLAIRSTTHNFVYVVAAAFQGCFSATVCANTRYLSVRGSRDRRSTRQVMYVIFSEWWSVIKCRNVCRILQRKYTTGKSIDQHASKQTRRWVDGWPLAEHCAGPLSQIHSMWQVILLISYIWVPENLLNCFQSSVLGCQASLDWISHLMGQWPKHCRGLARRLGANLFDYLNTLCFFIFHVKLVCVKSRSFHVFLAGASQSGIALFGRGWTRVRHITVQVLENLQSWEIASCKHISPWGLLQRWHLPSTQGI